MDNRIRQRDAASLAGYGHGQRMLETLAVAVFFSIVLITSYRLWGVAKHNYGVLLFAVFTGFVLADFLSGVVHWACDTWGSPDLPIVGKSFIRTFREHHVDQKAITHHDFVEANGSNGLIATIILLPTLFVSVTANATWRIFSIATTLSFTWFILWTSQIHKWSHMEQPPFVIRTLQSMRLILHPIHHAKHHSAPFDRNYCITTGWLNRPLQAIGFFRGLERLITATTGAIPRADDIGTNAALDLAKRQGVVQENGTVEPNRTGIDGKAASSVTNEGVVKH